MAAADAPVKPKLREPELRAWRGLLRAHSSIVKALDAELEASHGMALTSYEVLARLAQAPGGRMRMCDLAESVLLSRSGLTRMVDRLGRDGLVSRGSCEHDARGSFAVITDAGIERFQNARVTHLEGIRRHFLGRFSSDELEQLNGFCARLAGAS
jgi:DNA-binding MarR family transcriptional regulator